METFRGTTGRSSLRFTGAILAGGSGRLAFFPARELAEPAADHRLVRIHRERASEVIAGSHEVAETPGGERHEVQRLRVAGIPRGKVPEDRLRGLALLRLEEGLAQRGTVPEVLRKGIHRLAQEFHELKARLRILLAAFRIRRDPAVERSLRVVIAVSYGGQENVVRLVPLVDELERD